ncbi:flagella basal body P-ring formation protein FlgA [Paraburkholderia terricola]|uniref:Flagella basal body P-ring formation protein FlgA n=1 Tax=Paraburkholderia terricola TaxID=169427 RepID=A0ABU1LXQ5_9BURK|nr:flagella basal body P-ring formation protein FlgA [Paraburkholderia terricola]MDR6411305.1 flagella basal body P-ring formation protein FlgA [Paraburkholderia terricola]MDR6483455.1 flagella basal body P-ring formation protein FlgA [Paraburkholderia terricola]
MSSIDRYAPGMRHRHELRLQRLALAGALTCAATVSPASEPHVVFHATSDVMRQEVRLGDVADLSALPARWRAQAAELVVARLRAHDTRTDISATRLAEAARRQVPALTPWLTTTSTHRVAIVQHAMPASERKPLTSANAPRRHCLQLTRPASRGEAIRASEVVTVECPVNALLVNSIHHDREAHVARASRDLAPGDIVAAITPRRLAHIRQGERVSTVVRAGPFTVERTETALTDGTSGRAAILAVGDRKTVSVSGLEPESR